MSDIVTYPVWHFMGVCQPVMVVENHDGGDHAAGHHEHDAVEVGPWAGWTIGR